MTAKYKFVDTGKLYNINRKEPVMPMFILYGGNERVQAQFDVWHHHDQPPLPLLLFCESNNRISGVSRRTKKKSIKRKDGANSRIHQGWNHFICMFTPLTGGTLIKFHRDLEGRLVKSVTTSNL